MLKRVEIDRITKRRAALAVFLIVVCTLMSNAMLARRDARVLKNHLDHIRRAADSKEADVYAEEIRAMGPRVFPALLWKIQPPESGITVWVTKFLRAHHLLKQKKEDPAAFRYPAIYALSHFSKPELEGVLCKIRFFEGALWEAHAEPALEIIGPPASNALVKACQSPNPIVRAKAAYMLGEVSQPQIHYPLWIWRTPLGILCNMEGQKDFTALENNTHHPDLAVRRATAEALQAYRRLYVGSSNAVVLMMSGSN